MTDLVGLRTKHWSELAKEEKDFLKRSGIINGFGPSGHPFFHWLLVKIAPRFKETDADHHDFSYWKGGNQSRKEYCDYQFFLAMMEDAKHIRNKWKFTYYVVLAYIYYKSVDLFGFLFFHYT